MSDESSVQCIASIKHWYTEIKSSFENGKTVFIFINTPENVFVNTHYSLSGTGRSQKSTRHVNEINSFEMLPVNFKDKKIAKGQNVKLTQDGDFLKSYWETVKKFCDYDLYFEHETAKPLIITKSGNKTVGAIITNKNGGVILLLPPIKLPDDFTGLHSDGKTPIWTSKAIQFGKSLLNQIVAIDKSLKSSSENTPPPDWINEAQFQLSIEQKYLDEIVKLEEQIVNIQSQIEKNRVALEKNLLSKKLLYENGKPLEYAIIDALQIIGFKAENYDDGKSEFDIIFESEEGRFIGEAEGKDNSAIAITKFRQLESNILDDFERDEIKEHAKGVLFGNPFRLTHPNERKEFFTQKAIDSAKRSDIVLVNTHELFEVVKYLKNTNDKQYAKKIRECFKNIKGEIIKFPQR
ncbi:coiled-coil domain-containing protein [Sulfurospirillum sp.]|uniref:coiled-coil domain-containing protein n=1 Tax=Sulfurospirillum sp. TaxID=2053622 RepID=UPI002FDC9516